MSRIYASEQAGNRYKGRNRAVGFAPVTTVNDTKAIQQYAAALDQDARVLAGDITRQMQLDNQELAALQQAEAANLRVDQTYKSALEQKREISQNQLLEQSQLRQRQDLQASQLELQQDNNLFNLQANQNLAQFQLSSQQGLASSQLQQQNTLALGQQEQRQLLQLSQLTDRNLLQAQTSAVNAEQSLNQQYVAAKGRVAQANLKSANSVIQTLIKLAPTYFDYLKDQKDEAEKEKLQTERLDALGITVPAMANPVDPEVKQAASVQNAVIESESQALNNVADNLNGNSAVDIYTETTLRQGTTWKALQANRGNVYAARAMYPAALAEFAASGAMRPGAAGYADAEKFTRSFVTAAGLLTADRAQVADVFAPTALQEIQNTVLKVTQQHSKGIVEANKQTVENAVSSITDGAGPSEIGLAYADAFKEVQHGNIGFNPSEKKRIAGHTLDLMLKNLSSEGAGNLQTIKALRGHVYNPSSGRTLGADFDNVFDSYEQTAINRNVQNWNQQDALAKQEVEQIRRGLHYDRSPENYEASMARLEQMQHPAATTERNRQEILGLAYDPEVIQELKVMKAKGVYINPATIERLELQGYPAESLKDFKVNPIQEAAENQVEALLRGRNYQKDLLGVNPTRNLTNEFIAEAQTREIAYREDLKNRMVAEVVANPRLADDPGAFAAVLEKQVQYLKGLDRYTVVYPENTIAAHFKSSLNVYSDSMNKLGVTVSGRPGVQDLSTVKPETFENNSVFRSVTNISRDRLYTNEALKADLKILVEGDGSQNYSARTIGLSRALGVSPKALLNEQLKVIGGPDVELLRQQHKQQQDQPTASISNMQAGFAALRQLDVPTRGAAYLAGNIQTESGWEGQRQPWDDVGAPAGGLVSWRAGRLLNIQKHFGKPIEQISDMEQLTYMLHEMKTKYPKQYGVFMNPNSTDSMLQEASYRFWGWGVQGDRFTNAQSLLR